MLNLKLKDIRETKELNQIKIAKILKVSQPVYARWESEERIIPLSRLRELCNYFEVSMDYVFNLDKFNKYHFIPSFDKKKIGNNLARIRKQNKFTQQQMANFLNTTQSTICAYENGKTLILTPFLYQFCQKCHASMDEICM